MRRLHAAVIALIVWAAPLPAGASETGAALDRWYAQKAHWKAVRREVLRWHHTTRNGCVAFLSTALRRIGVDVPRDAEVDGEKVSRLTRPFSLWLEDHLGWQRIEDVAALEPGDVVFTEQAEYPWHVFVFHDWADEEGRVARVLDNRGFLKRRPLLGDDEAEITPFAYALRAP